MDRRFQRDDHLFNSPVIKLRSFLESSWDVDCQFRSMFGRLPADKTQKEEHFHGDQLKTDFSNLTGCSTTTSNNIFDKDLSIRNLMPCPEDMPPRQSAKKLLGPGMLQPEFLRTHEYTADRVQKAINPQRKSGYLRTCKYDRWENSEIGLLAERPDWYRTTHKDIMITVSVMRPNNKIPTGLHLRDSRKLWAQSKFLVRGDTSLLNLRRKLTCIEDMIVPLEDGKELEPPDMKIANMVQYPSSFMFIHDTFYLDTSIDGATDITQPIRDFMARKSCFDDTFVKDIREAKVIDLTLRLGAPYLFQHSGTCEHLIIFHDLRLLHKNDIQICRVFQELDRYPLVAFEKGGDVRCTCCDRFAAFCVSECDRLPAASMMFCDSCFREFHFPHGVKTGQFVAHPYFQMNKLTFV